MLEYRQKKENYQEKKNEEALKPSGWRYFSATFILISYLLAACFFPLFSEMGKIFLHQLSLFSVI